jgi:hypothetical protein
MPADFGAAGPYLVIGSLPLFNRAAGQETADLVKIPQPLQAITVAAGFGSCLVTATEKDCVVYLIY